MLFKIESEHFGGEVKVISSTRFPDYRGYYTIPYREDEFTVLGLPTNFVQDNYSRSVKDVIRGLHFQLNPPMGKLMRVTSGKAFLVTVDIRPASPTFLEWLGMEVSEENGLQIWAPAEFARGICSLTDDCVVQYKTTGMFDAKADSAIRWDDPHIGIKWPVLDSIVSVRDQAAPLVTEAMKSRMSRI